MILISNIKFYFLLNIIFKEKLYIFLKSYKFYYQCRIKKNNFWNNYYSHYEHQNFEPSETLIRLFNSYNKKDIGLIVIIKKT